MTNSNYVGLNQLYNKYKLKGLYFYFFWGSQCFFLSIVVFQILYVYVIHMR